MAEFGAAATLSGPWGSIDFNTRTAAEWFIDDIDGLDGEPIDAPIDPLSLEDGDYAHDFWGRGRHITIKGTITLDATLTAYQQIVQRNEMERDLRHLCRSMKRIGEEGTWAWAPSGVGPYSLSVRCDLQPKYTGKSPREFLFGLFAANPDYD